MEAAIWDKAVFYGPSMADFQDAVQILEAADAGFMVRDAAELAERLQACRRDPEAYRLACRRAGEAARAQLGAARKQAAMIIDGLTR